MSAYGAFAQVYDQLMDDFDYPAWADYYLELFRRANVEPRTLCECACGTGSMTVQFALRGIRAIGVDLSGEMLEVASAKARREGAQVMFVLEDMRALELAKPVDALACPCDGVNYLIGDGDLTAFFRAAHAAIRPGGALAFDISSAYKLEHVLGNGFFGEERDEVAYLWANRFDAARRTLRMDLTFFLREPNGLYRRFSEVHTQRAHEPEAIVSLLMDSGYTHIEVFGDRTLQAPGDHEQRIHFVAVRE